MKIHLADIFYLLGESPPSIFPLEFRYIYFLIARSVPVLKLPEKMYYSLSISVTNKSRVSAEKSRNK